MTPVPNNGQGGHFVLWRPFCFVSCSLELLGDLTQMFSVQEANFFFAYNWSQVNISSKRKYAVDNTENSTVLTSTNCFEACVPQGNGI